MTKRIKTTLGTVAALSALALGGSAIAGAASQPTSKAPVQSTQSTAPADNVQDTTSPDAPGTPAEASGETGGAAGAEAPGSEVTANDGPGGHADEPGNPTADNQSQGVQ
jgi:hypothetical protein